MDVALFSGVLGAQLDQSGVIHSRAGRPGATSQDQTGASSRAGAGLLLFLLKHVAQGALAGSRRLLQKRTQEAVGRSGAVTWHELDQDEKVKKRGTSFRIWRRRRVRRT